MAMLIKAPARLNAICQHIVKHFQEKVEPNGFKAQVVTFDRECYVLYKKAMDELVGPEVSAIVMHTQGGKSDEYAEWKLAKDEEEILHTWLDGLASHQRIGLRPSHSQGCGLGALAASFLLGWWFGLD